MKYLDKIFIIGVFSLKIVFSATYYVSTQGDDNNDGLSPSTAWRTIAYAASQAMAGDTVYIEAGNYGAEDVWMVNSGYRDSPIVFIGYKNVPGDIPEPPLFDIYNENGLPVPQLDPSEMPLIDSGRIYIYYANYIEIRNIQIRRPYANGTCLLAEQSRGLKFVNIITQGGRDGIWLKTNCDSSVIYGCQTIDADMTNIFIRASKYCVIYNSVVHGTGPDDPHFPDYFIIIADNYNEGGSMYNRIEHCLVQNTGTYVAGHGIGFKGFCEYNEIVDCVARGTMKGFYVWNESYNNVIRNSIAIDCVSGFLPRGGARKNYFINNRSIGSFVSINFAVADSNFFINCILEGNTETGIRFGSEATNNLIKNCVFFTTKRDFSKLFGPADSTSQGNVLKNSIVYGFTNYSYLGADLSGVSVTYCNFWKNGFSAPSGEGNIEVDPLFADTLNSDYHLKSEYGRWTENGWVFDDTTSPCIDAGDPLDDYSNEPQPNGGRINMGAYGNTAEASKSPGTWVNEKNSVENTTLIIPRLLTSKIIYQMSNSDYIRIEVYDLSGRNLRNIHLTRLSAPTGEGSELNLHLNKGIYFIYFKTEHMKGVKKISVIK